MKRIFSAIGHFFGSIWRWIKETAWVQPLLIVSLIFGVILLIQPISEGITSLADSISKNEKYYKDNKVTLVNNRAYNLVYDDDTRFKDYDKYFLVFVSKTCSNCSEAYKGFKTLMEDDTFTEDYKIKTIYIDEQKDVDFHEDKTSYMYKLFFSGNDEVIDFRDAIYEAATNSPYYEEVNTDEYDGYLQAIRGEDISDDDIYTPLILLMDKETFEADNKSFGIKEALVGLKGSSNYDKARTLDHCWNTTDEFERD